MTRKRLIIGIALLGISPSRLISGAKPNHCSASRMSINPRGRARGSPPGCASTVNFKAAFFMAPGRRAGAWPTNGDYRSGRVVF